MDPYYEKYLDLRVDVPPRLEGPAANAIRRMAKIHILGEGLATNKQYLLEDGIPIRGGSWIGVETFTHDSTELILWEGKTLTPSNLIFTPFNWRFLFFCQNTPRLCSRGGLLNKLTDIQI